METQYSQRTLDALTHLGWTKAYSGGAALLRKALTQQGHEMPACVYEFLERFGNLACYQTSPFQPAMDAFHIDAAQAGQRVSRASLTPHEATLAARLCPIGECGYGFYSLLMDANGVAYALNDYGELTEWAENGTDLIELLCGTVRLEPEKKEDSYVEWMKRQRGDQTGNQ